MSSEEQPQRAEETPAPEEEALPTAETGEGEPKEEKDATEAASEAAEAAAEEEAPASVQPSQSSSSVGKGAAEEGKNGENNDGTAQEEAANEPPAAEAPKAEPVAPADDRSAEATWTPPAERKASLVVATEKRLGSVASVSRKSIPSFSSRGASSLNALPSRMASSAAALRAKEGEKGSERRDLQVAGKSAPLSAANVKGSLWQQVLADARPVKTADKPDSYILMLGACDAGKSTLLRHLQALGSIRPLSRVETYSNTGGVSLLDYAYLGQRCLDDEEDIATVDAQSYANVYIIQNPEMAERIAGMLPASAISHLCFLICLDMRQAWSAMDELQKWLRVAEQITNSLLSQQDLQTQDKLKSDMQRYLANYRRNALNTGVTRAATALLDLQQFGSSAAIGNDEAQKLLEVVPKADGAAEDNAASFPVPVVVAVTRSDAYQQMNTRQSMGQIDIMMAYLRRECLKFNAALFSCNARDEKNPKNLFLLYRYLMHRLCRCFFRATPATDDPEAFFMPAGCDTTDDIERAMAKTVAETFEKPYEAWITRSTESKKLDDTGNTTVPIQTMQEFLRLMEEQYPTAAVAAKPLGERRLSLLLNGQGSMTSSFGRSESGRRSVGSISRPMISIQPSTTMSRSEVHSKATVPSLNLSGDASVDKARSRPEVPRMRSGAPGKPGSIAPAGSANLTPHDGSGAAESASLQNFFQGLLARSKTKAPATPRGRARPKAAAEGAKKKLAMRRRVPQGSLLGALAQNMSFWRPRAAATEKLRECDDAAREHKSLCWASPGLQKEDG
ncbi:hypothetical protein BESB_005600 [Besnoitia besnoiti]|uniref:Dynein light intermediate chain n=1 Tax=Besnoitia besnoiti TaxID=94643 RepID=A0A2A9MJX5_BESBE|nr:hypothetical protein BESB_005600 [Besnoitia besnoiti]PFH38219.1 hypothetical protein BESB_005600 [Besnoitia besnoiti]